MLPGSDPEFRARLAEITLGPGELRVQDGRGVRLLTLAGPRANLTPGIRLADAAP